MKHLSLREHISNFLRIHRRKKKKVTKTTASEAVPKLGGVRNAPEETVSPRVEAGDKKIKCGGPHPQGALQPTSRGGTLSK